jgi:hypothetical protein
VLGGEEVSGVVERGVERGGKGGTRVVLQRSPSGV